MTLFKKQTILYKNSEFYLLKKTKSSCSLGSYLQELPEEVPVRSEGYDLQTVNVFTYLTSCWPLKAALISACFMSALQCPRQ